MYRTGCINDFLQSHIAANTHEKYSCDFFFDSDIVVAVVVIVCNVTPGDEQRRCRRDVEQHAEFGRRRQSGGDSQETRTKATVGQKGIIQLLMFTHVGVYSYVL